MSESNGTARKKPVASEASNDAAANLLKKYSDLMRAAGSTNGAWYPDPDEHILGMLRDDVQLSPNEIKLVYLVKLCCLRPKLTDPSHGDFGNGRTLWGWTETGKPLRLTEVMSFFGWDWGNADKYSRRPLAHGFIRKNAEGQFGIGARVQGKFEPEADPPSAPPEEDELVCTDKLPEYLAVQIQRYSKPDRLKFLRGWRTIKGGARERLNKFKQQNYKREMEELSSHCKAFQLELKRKNEPAGDAAERSDGDLSVQTSSVQNDGEPVYSARNESVPTDHIRRHSTAVSFDQHSSSSSEPAAAEPEATTTTEKAFLIRVLKALDDRGISTDAEAARKLIAACREKSADCTIEEIEHFIPEKIKLLPRGVRYPMAWLAAAVSKCFDPESLAVYRERVTAAAREMERQLQYDPADFRLPEPPPQEPKPSQPAFTLEQRADLEKQLAEVIVWLEEHATGNDLAIRAAKKERRRLERELEREAVSD